VDRADINLLVRIADNPEFDSDQDKVLLTALQTRTNGYAREDDRWIIFPGQTCILDFDAFEFWEWVELAAKNEGANLATITLVDAWGVQFTIPLPVGACILSRCLKVWKGGGDEPYLYSADGSIVRVFCWGVPLVVPPP
jgi:hypothetical protein